MATYPLLEHWPHKWFGFFMEEGYAAAGIPSMAEVSDPQWNPADKSALCRYLSTAPVYIYGLCRRPDLLCRQCGANLGDPTVHQSDGVWVWPGDLAHLVAEHGVSLPAAFVEHIRERKYKPPRKLKNFGPIDWPSFPQQSDDKR